MLTSLKYIIALLVLMVFQLPSFSQSDSPDLPADYDTLYIQTFPKSIATSIFFSGQFANIQITNPEELMTLEYEPNSLTGMGASVSAKWISVGFSYGFKFLNPDEQQGKTKAIDFQTHIYSRKFIIDLFAEIYKGMYLANTFKLNPDYPDPYYLRPDIDLKIFGASGFYIFNNKKYSAQAARVQSERQLKSAGSLLVGFEGYWGKTKADSVFTPYFLGKDDLADMRGFDEYSFLKFGPSVGYAYTLVIAKRLYFNAALTGNVSLGESATHHVENGDESQFKADLGIFLRLAAGYNTPRWCLGINVIYNNIGTRTIQQVPTVTYGVSEVHIGFIYRFNLSEKLESKIDKVNIPFID